MNPRPEKATTVFYGAFYGGLVFALSFSLFAYLQFAGPEIVGSDGYYHIKVADLMRQYGMPLEFPWLQFTILDRQAYTDHHFLLHVLQVPFTTFFEDLSTAAKWSAVFAAALSFAVIAVVLHRCDVRWPWLWTFLLFACSSPFLYRMSMARGQSISLALQVLIFYLMLRKRYVPLAVSCAAFVWAYNAFPIVLPLAVAGVIVHYWVDRRVEYSLVLAVTAGLVAGLVTHPYFPQNVHFLWNHIIPKLFVIQYPTGVGREWYPYDSWEMFSSSMGAMLAYLLGVLLNGSRDLRTDRARLFWFLTSSFYLVMFFKSRRFAEYFPPSAMIFLALSVRAWPFWERPREYLRDKLFAVGSLATVGLTTSYLLWVMQDVRRDIRSQAPAAAYRGAALWLSENTPSRSTVFHTDWDDFPKLFHFNTHNLYIVGLDPDFMRLKNPELYEQWKNVTRGSLDEPAAVIDKFGAQHVFTDRKHKKFIGKLEAEGRFEKVYSDPWSIVYRSSRPGS